MFTSPIDARDEMFAKFETGFNAVSAAIIGRPEQCEIRWQFKRENELPDDYFVRVSTKGAGTDLASFLENGEGASDQVFDTYGNLFVQVFAPMTAEDAGRIGELLAIAARDIFLASDTPGGVWFRNARYVELEDDGKFYRWKVTVEFEFSER